MGLMEDAYNCKWSHCNESENLGLVKMGKVTNKLCG